MDELYPKIVLEHYKKLLNKGKLLKPDIIIEESNPMCKDFLEVFLKIKNDELKDISYEGKGCVLSLAVASLLSEKLKGKTLNEIKKIKREDLNIMLKTDIPKERSKCVTILLSAIKKGIKKYEEEK